MRRTEKDIPVQDYNGVKVVLAAGTNRFYAVVGGQGHWGGSWDTLKKKLDAAGKFEPFSALTLCHDAVVQVDVTSADLEESRWVVEKHGTTHSGTRIHFHEKLYPLDMRDQLETYLGELTEWDRAQQTIMDARNAERNRIEALALTRPDRYTQQRRQP